ncbi:Fis family transcriptional regulator [Psychromonas antarctica]|uniref:Fis family transcriptional regulator n=1 Tax=Psychromonas antarctica TaxID=67573 RepID=UPI001EE984CD|nr:Fis family transcriptional regulator [Psychromonas antarctica]MCG6202672.1 Fis family transcriptional regulator [Psychromonas antarctica]
MRKTDKKTDNKLRLSLTDVCEVALREIDGFQWITHVVDYSKSPISLKIFCIFDTNKNLAFFLSKNSKQQLASLIVTKLHEVNVEFKKPMEHIFYDTEENCEKDHHGKWSDRLG